MNEPVDQAGTTDIRTATVHDLEWICHLQRKFAHALGWIPRPGMIEPLEKGRVLLANENASPAGFIYNKQLHGEPHIRSIVQAAVAMDAQRRHHGLDVLKIIEAGAQEDLMQCWCAEELEANQFWLAAGYQPIALRDPENVRGRRLILWRKPLTPIGKTLITEAPKRAGPCAARPKNMIILTEDQRVTITREAPQDLQAALAAIQIAHPSTSVELSVEELLAIYVRAKGDPKLNHLATEIAVAVAEQLAEQSPTTRKEPHEKRRPQ